MGSQRNCQFSQTPRLQNLLRFCCEAYDQGDNTAGGSGTGSPFDPSLTPLITVAIKNQSEKVAAPVRRPKDEMSK